MKISQTMLIKLRELSSEQFASLSKFLASERNIITAPKGASFDCGNGSTCGSRKFATIIRASEASGAIDPKAPMMEITLQVVVTVLLAASGGLTIPIGLSRLADLLGSLGIFP